LAGALSGNRRGALRPCKSEEDPLPFVDQPCRCKRFAPRPTSVSKSTCLVCSTHLLRAEAVSRRIRASSDSRKSPISIPFRDRNASGARRRGSPGRPRSDGCLLLSSPAWRLSWLCLAHLRVVDSNRRVRALSRMVIHCPEREIIPSWRRPAYAGFSISLRGAATLR